MADYNGWTNYPTWNVKLWLDNDQGSQEECARLARTASRTMHPALVLADTLKAIVENSTPGLGPSMYQDILGWALEQVNWRQIAEAYLEDREA